MVFQLINSIVKVVHVMSRHNVCLTTLGMQRLRGVKHYMILTGHVGPHIFFRGAVVVRVLDSGL